MVIESINSLEGWESEELVDEIEVERIDKSLEVGKISFFEDGGGVEGNNVDIIYLLGKYDSEGGESCMVNMGNGEELIKVVGVVGVVDEFFFNFKLSVDVVDIVSDLDRVGM